MQDLEQSPFLSSLGKTEFVSCLVLSSRCLPGKLTVTVIRLIIRSALPLRLTSPAGKQEGRIRATHGAEIRRGRTSGWVECTPTHKHTEKEGEPL